MDMQSTTALDARAQTQQFYDQLVAHGLIVPAGVAGVFGRSARFEQVLEAFNALVTRVSAADGAELFTFPPVIDRRVLERVGYMDSFPDLCGAVYSFAGGDREARELSERIHAGKPWGDALGMSNLVLNPAACYPLYPTLSGTLPPEGRLVTMLNWVYRHEPSPEATRMQAFRVREFVRAGSLAQVLAWRDMWLERGVTLLCSLQLQATTEVASDPFFGRGGRMLAHSQKEQKLKYEVLIPVNCAEQPTAVCSFNYHQQHFGSTFAIQGADGQAAYSACLGFGLERVTMALFRAHGFEASRWPRAVRQRLWP